MHHTFRQQHYYGYIQRRFDYSFISNILASFSTDHSPITFSLSSKSEETGDKGLLKHDNSLHENSTCINSMKKHFISNLENLKNESITDEQSVW